MYYPYDLVITDKTMPDMMDTELSTWAVEDETRYADYPLRGFNARCRQKLNPEFTSTKHPAPFCQVPDVHGNHRGRSGSLQSCSGQFSTTATVLGLSSIPNRCNPKRHYNRGCIANNGLIIQC